MEDENSLIAQRREKLDTLQARGANPFGHAYETSGTIAEVREKFAEGTPLRAAGRITAHRDMGKSHFVDLRDSTGRMQVYIHAKEVGAEVIEFFKLVDLGDFIGVEGTCFLTKTGEPTLKVHKLELLGKALRPLPEKWHGLQDVEARYRQRYLDLITNEQSRAVFEKRIVIMREIRRFMESRGFLEVETPMLQAVAGGAAAEPFRTRARTLSSDCAGALSQAFARRRFQQGVRVESKFPERRHFPKAQSGIHHARSVLGLLGFPEDSGPGRGDDLSFGGDAEREKWDERKFVPPNRASRRGR
jgi:lysyl-tRNA synthetase class 2